MCTSSLSRSKYPFGKERRNHVLDAGLTGKAVRSPRVGGGETTLLTHTTVISGMGTKRHQK